MGSRATHVASGMGGLHGRALEVGDRLAIGSAPEPPAAPGCRRRSLVALPDGGTTVRVMLGPQQDMFTAAALDTLRTSRYHVSSQSNRMGYRLTGPALEPGGAW